MEKFNRFFCEKCGKWLGVEKDGFDISGVFPYCPRCKKQVGITTLQPQRNKLNTFSAECRQR